MMYWLSVSLESLPNFSLSWVSSFVYSLSLHTLRHVTLQLSTVVSVRFRYYVSVFWTPCNLCSLHSNAKQDISQWIRNFKITASLNATPCGLMGRCQRYGRIFYLHRQVLFRTLLTTYRNARRPIPQYNSHNFRSLYNVKRHTRILQFHSYLQIRPEHVRPEFSYLRLDITDIFWYGNSFEDYILLHHVRHLRSVLG
jgi:hypothetical protein